ncbi:MAG: hypothetical protein ACRD2F_05325 [Terriglobales bacterium]
MAVMSVREQLEARLSARGWGATLARESGGLRAAGGELVAGGITELVPDVGGAGTTACALRLAAGWAGRIAWADPGDRLDPESAERAGVALERVLWLRGMAKLRGMEGLSRWNEILNLVIQSHAVELVVADFLDWPMAELRRIPRSAWFRLLRGLEHGQQTALLLVTPAPVASSCVRVRLTPSTWPSRGELV